MKVLFVSQYADPNLVGGNNNVYRQAEALRHSLGVDVEILTWPEDDTWSGPLPCAENAADFMSLKWEYQGLNYHVVKLSRDLLERSLDNKKWEYAVEIGCRLLKDIKPSIVHLQHWKGLWWILESARRLAIPTVYTPHDWGMCCLRTTLTKGEGGLCDGVVDIEKCMACILAGRNLLGRTNEFVVSSEMGECLIKKMAESSAIDHWLSRQSAVRMGLRKRLTFNYCRAKSALMNLSAIIVPNSFGKVFYRQFGIADERIYVEPWYYDLEMPAIAEQHAAGARIVLGYIGRISPEKGLSRVFEALADNLLTDPIHFVIAGELIGEYANNLYSRFSHKIGKHSVEWMGWVPHKSVHKFYEKVDVVIIPSECIENGPLTLIESFAFKKPVIISDMPSVRDLVEEGRTGYLITLSSIKSLVFAIRKASLKQSNLQDMKNNMPVIKSSFAYTSVVNSIYKSIEKEHI